jgi:hypothetical protein
MFLVKALTYLAPIIISIAAASKIYTTGLILKVLWTNLATGATAAYALITGKATIAQTALNTSMLANPIGIIILAIGLLIGAVVMLYIHWDKVKAAFISAWGVIKNILFSVADIIMSTYGNLFKFIIQGLSAIAGFLGFDTSGLDAFIGKIEQVQKTVKAGTGFNASVTTNNAAGMPGVQTTGSSIQKSISENNNNMMVTVGNKSENQVYGNGKQIKTGSTMALTPTG